MKPPTQQPAEFSLSDWLGLLQRNWKTIAIFSGTTGFVALLASFIASPVYEATAMVQVDSSNVRAAMLAESPLQPNNELYTQVELARSNAVLERACVKLGLSSTTSGSHEDVVKKMGKQVRVSPLRNTNLISITASDHNPDMARDIANSVADSLMVAGINRKRSESRRVREFLDAQLAKLRGELLQSEANLSQRAVKVNEEVYKLLLSRRHEANIAENSDIGAVSVVDPAVSPEKPVRPRKSYNTLLGLFLGALIGFVMTMWKEQREDTVKSLEELENLTDIPVLGWIPQTDTRPGKEWLVDPCSILKDEEKAQHLEPYHLLIGSLDLLPASVPRKAFLITSSLPQEGKSRTSACLALTMAREGKKVILVELDLRRPTLEGLWNVSSPGLTSVLDGKARLEDAIKTCEGNENISLLPAGKPSANPVELIRGPQLGEIIKSLRDKYDIVLVDSPPVLLTPDTLKVASLLDGVLFVVQAESAPKTLIRRALDQMTRGSVKVLGLVLNRVPERTSSYGSYYGGGYGYYSKKAGKDGKT
jgi:capsular exopolysaccharide synthesis family protein